MVSVLCVSLACGNVCQCTSATPTTHANCIFNTHLSLSELFSAALVVTGGGIGGSVGRWGRNPGTGRQAGEDSLRPFVPSRIRFPTKHFERKRSNWT